MSSAAWDPAICLAKCFSSWFSIQLLMSSIVVWYFIIIGVSGFLMNNDGGSFVNMNLNGQTPFTDWTTSVCTSSPFRYVVPFAFSFQSATVSSSLAYCGFGKGTNTIFRLVIACMGVVTMLILFFDTPFSIFARPTFFVYAMLFFAIAVLDINSVAMGMSNCTSGFAGTDIGDAIKQNSLQITCQENSYETVCVFSIIQTIQYFILYSAWLFCTEKYKYSRRRAAHSQLLPQANPAAAIIPNPAIPAPIPSSSFMTRPAAPASKW